jgi:hypothetical protein
MAMKITNEATATDARKIHGLGVLSGTGDQSSYYSTDRACDGTN